METILKVGDKAVYPGHGVGQITSIEDKNIMAIGLHAILWRLQIPALKS